MADRNTDSAAEPQSFDDEADAPSRFDRVLGKVSLVSAVLLAFLLGGVLTAADTFPGTEIANAYKGGKALYVQATQYKDVYHTDLWYPQRSAARGTVVEDKTAMEPGVTLFTTGESASAYLIDGEGRVLHKWHKPFSEIWDAKKSSIRRPMPDDHVYMRKALMYPNGDLVAVYEGNGDTPYGYAVVKLDKDSNLKWVYFGRAHHDIDIGPDGRIYALIHGFVKTRDKVFDNLATPRLEDSLVILSPEGKELKKIPLLKAVGDTRYKALIYTVAGYSLADPLHANDVDVITEEDAKNFPFGKAGQLLVSFRELGAVGVLDPDSGKMVWMTRGTWLGQHDPDILPNGNIMLFDNNGGFGSPDNTSRVLEFDPKTMAIVWQYAGTPDHPLGSVIRSAAQRLKNGNTLITESNGGRIIEVTKDGRIVWEFVSPIRGGDAKEAPRLPIICQAQRIDMNAFDNSILKPQEITQASAADTIQH